MLGEQLGEIRGKRSMRRVIPVDGGIKVEVSFEESGKMLGIDVMSFGTYNSSMRHDGSLYGEGQGGLMGQDGSMATWKGSGVGKLQGGGAVSFRGAVCYSTSSAKFARLNTVAGIFEHEVDAEGNTHTKIWEWK